MQELVNIASELMKSNEDFVNVDTIVNDAIDAPTEEEKYRMELLSLIKPLIVSVYDDIPADVNTLEIKGVATMAREDLHGIKAKAKNGKTSMLTAVEAAYIGKSGIWGPLRRIGEPLKVLHIDTEQKLYDSQSFKKRVLDMADITEEELAERFVVVNLRSIIDIELKKNLVEASLEEYKPDVLVIDGIVDFISNFNEIDESKALIDWMMQIADKYKIVLIYVLHTNKSSMDHNMRGHLGTMAEQKCGTTTECVKAENSNIVTVKCANSRHRPFPDWSFMWDDAGNIVDAEQQVRALALQQAEQLKAERERKALEAREGRKQKMLSVLKIHGGHMARKELTETLEREFNVSRKTVSPLITTWVTEGVVYECGGTIYDSPQTELFG